MINPKTFVAAEPTMQPIAPAHHADSPQRWGLLLLLFTGMVFCFVHRGALNVAAPLMLKELGLSTATMGVLLSAFSWTYTLGQSPAGWFVDRYGFRRAYAVGYAVWALATAALGMTRSLPMLVALRMCAGAGQSTVFPASARAIANAFEQRERGLANAGYISGNRLGLALINGVGALLLAAIGWKYFFFFVGLLPLVWLAPWWKFAARWDQRRAATESQPTAPSSGLSFLGSLALLRHRSLLGICLGFFAYDYAWFLMLTWLPGYLVMERKFNTQEMAFYSSIPFLLSVFISLLTGAMSDWLTRRGHNELRVRRNLILFGMAVACLIVPAGLAANKIAAVWMLTLAVGGLSVAAPMTWALTQAVCDKRIVGTASGLQNLWGNLGGILSPLLTGFIAHATGSFALALGVAGAILLTGIAAYWLLVNQRVELPEEPSGRDATP